MALDSHYIPAFSIEDVLLDKDTGAPLTGGLVYFEQDNQRGVLKPVYQITGTSPNYTYVPLPNPVVLSSIGTFEDGAGNPVIPYFYPYDGNGDAEYYYIRVTNADGVEQFTRDAQPYLQTQSSSEVSSSFTNALSNPQFSEVLFDTSAGTHTYTIGTVTNQIISIAPSWDLVVSCASSGSVTVQQLKPAGSQNMITNAGTLLSITSAGLSKLQLRQRLTGYPSLWGNGYLSASFVAKTYSGTSPTLTLSYHQSSGSVSAVPLLSVALDATGAYARYVGSVAIPSSNSGGTYPTAYVEIYFDLPLSIKVDITSVMVAYTGTVSVNNIAYDQESYQRQIDHLYHYAYPIVPIGTIIVRGGFAIPTHYLLCNGQAVSRETYHQLFEAITKADTATWTGVTTFTVASVADYWIGMPVEGTSIPVATTVTNIVGTTITISNNRTGTNSSVRFFSEPAGNGTTTFNVPDLRDYVIAMSGGSLFGATRNGPGAFGGSATHTITTAEMPSHTHGAGGSGTAFVELLAGGPSGLAAGTGLTTSTVTASAGSGTAMTLVQQTALYKMYIRYQ
jgi:microcystin-dependent protein